MNLPETSTYLDCIEDDIWKWINEFVTVKSAFYKGKFAPCPYALAAVRSKSVDVVVWRSGEFRSLIRHGAEQMRGLPHLTTRVLVFPPRAQHAWGLSQFVESLNVELVLHNIFLNTGIAKTTVSRYPGSEGAPYFIVIANSLDVVLQGAEALKRTDFYGDWPAGHYDIVVNRRERMSARYGRRGGVSPSHER
jgi:hypothetical protein